MFIFSSVVTRLIKYTGYGNAAGMLARRGLLAGGHGNTDYSPDEEDSDTEEYKDVRNEWVLSYKKGRGRIHSRSKNIFTSFAKINEPP